MESIGSKLRMPKLVKDDRRTERGEWLKKFCDRMNPERVAMKLRPITIPRMAVMLHGVPTGDLYAFWQACERAKHFGKYFWWSINPKKHENGNRK